MNYKVLYRKYRPKNFSEVVGQDSIIDVLKNSILKNKTAHAYLFTGVRGTGKTSVAKVFAKAINCINPINGDACCSCINCEMFDNSPDIIEIDAASNNGVDDIREIIGNSRLVPTTLNYKVYIIDEVHMLSSGAFNALLKTLEEPVNHVKFILATTEIQKVPLTILSRCQRFDFTRINSKYAVQLLEEICKKENIKYDIHALEEISILSEGSLRDALSMLDQLSNNNKKISVSDIENIFGSISYEKIENIGTIILNKDYQMFIEINANIKNDNIDIGVLINKLIVFFKNHLYESLNNKTSNLEYIKKIIIALVEIQSMLKTSYDNYIVFEVNILSVILENADKEEQKIEYSNKDNSNKRITPEEIINFEEKMTQKEEILKEEVISVESYTDEEREPKKLITEKIKSVRINNCFAEATKKSKEIYLSLWDTYIDYIKEHDLSKYSLLDHSNLEVASDKYLLISVQNLEYVDLLDIETINIENIFNKLYEKNIKICFDHIDKLNKEKERYKQNIKNGIKYELLSEPKIKRKINDAADKAKELFGEDNIDIR